MRSFGQFIDGKAKKYAKRLKLLGKVFNQHGFKTSEHFSAEQPYLYLKAPDEHQSEATGVRVYMIGDEPAYRAQRQPDTHPYGKAYPLDVTEMYEDALGEEGDEMKAGRWVVNALANEVSEFFRQSAEAERDMPGIDSPRTPVEDDSTGKAMEIGRL